jgi:hypothetical protein
MKMPMFVIFDKQSSKEKYYRLKLGGEQAYEHSSDYTAVVTKATNDRARSAVLSLN